MIIKLCASKHTHGSEREREAQIQRDPGIKVNPGSVRVLRIQKMMTIPCCLDAPSDTDRLSHAAVSFHTRMIQWGGDKRLCLHRQRKKRKATAKITSSLLIRLEFLQISTTATLRSQTYWRQLRAGENYPRCATGVKWGNRHCHRLCLYSPRTKTMATASTSNKASNPTEPEPCLLLHLNSLYSQGFNRNERTTCNGPITAQHLIGDTGNRLQWYWQFSN